MGRGVAPWGPKCSCQPSPCCPLVASRPTYRRGTQPRPLGWKLVQEESRTPKDQSPGTGCQWWLQIPQASLQTANYTVAQRLFWKVPDLPHSGTGAFWGPRSCLPDEVSEAPPSSLGCPWTQGGRQQQQHVRRVCCVPVMTSNLCWRTLR